MNSTIVIEKRQEAEHRLAVIVAQLVREGVALNVSDRAAAYLIELTGEY